MTRFIATLLRRFPALIRLPFVVYRGCQARYTVGVVAVTFDQLGQVLLVEHAYHPRFPWGLPGGWADANEDPAAAVLRELREELQLEARTIDVVHVSKTADNHIDLAFMCEALGAAGKLNHELLAYEWADVDNLPSLRPFHQRSIEAACLRRERSAQWARA